jgi:hypothetical protein
VPYKPWTATPPHEIRRYCVDHQGWPGQGPDGAAGLVVQARTQLHAFAHRFGRVCEVREVCARAEPMPKIGVSST